MDLIDVSHDPSCDKGFKLNRTNFPFYRGRWWLIGSVFVLLASSIVAYFLLDTWFVEWRKDTRFLFGRHPWILSIKSLGNVCVQLWILLLFSWVQGRKRIVVYGIIALIFVTVTVFCIKSIVQRSRPNDQRSEEITTVATLKWPGSYSFPSGDTTSAFAIAVICAGCIPFAWRIVPFALAGCVGVLRVLTLHHYPSDILSGAALGLICGALAFIIGNRWIASHPRAHTHFNWLKRAGWNFWLLLLLPLLYAMYDAEHFISLFRCFGPFIVAALLISKGESWLRWLRFMDHRRNEGARSAVRPPLSGREKNRVQFLQKSDLAVRGVEIVIVVLMALAILPALGWTTLFDSDEGYYVECAREMMERRNPFLPHYNNEPWMEKPPLTYWFMTLSMTVLGTTEFAARLPSALVGICAIWLTLYLGWRMFSLTAGTIAALVTGTSVLFSVIARMALMDTFLLCCVLLATLGLWKILTGEGRGAFLLFYLGCGLGGLAKGPLGIALPVLSLFGVMLVSSRWDLLKKIRPVQGALLICAIVGLWIIPASILSDGDYLRELVWVRTIQPIFSPLQGHGGGNILKYIALLPAYVPILILAVFPWSVFVFVSLKYLFTHRGGDAGITLLFGWLGAQLLAFSLVTTKLPHHILPLVPALALGIGAYIDVSLRKKQQARSFWNRTRITVYTIGGLLIGAGILSFPLIMGFRHEWIWFLPATLVIGTSGWWIAKESACGRNAKALCLAAASMIVCVSLVWLVGLPRLEYAKAPRNIASFFFSHYSEEELTHLRVTQKSVHQPSLVFYLKRPVPKISTRSEVDTFLQNEKKSVLIIAEKNLRKFQKEGLSARHYELWRKKVWIVGKASWETLLVISNREPT